jgi:hypothetical protein
LRLGGGRNRLGVFDGGQPAETHLRL